MKTVTLKEVLRYFLSASGIVVGIFLLISVLELIQGGRAVLADNFWDKGVKVYEIKVGDSSYTAGNLLSWKDGRLLDERMGEVRGSIPVLSLNGSLSSYKESENVEVLGVNEKYISYANLKLLKGTFISPAAVAAADRVAVLDDLTALELFGTTDIIGQKLDIRVGSRTVAFVVTGILKNYNKNIETLFDDEYPGICLIPESVPEDVSFSYKVSKLVALVDDSLHEEAAEIRLAHLLELEHGEANIYEVEEYDQLPLVREFADKYLIFAVITAIVGLVSGSIGVMYAMLLYIRERKKEIGLYKFFGAGIKELQYDLIYRTMTVCLTCGMLGLLFGVVTGNYIGSFINLPVRLSLTSVIATAATVFISGTLGSLYPASRIKRIDAGEAIWGE
ncbi:MAG: ABC transporter permease [Pseudomonadota bacterium]